DVNSMITQSVANIILKSLRKKPEERYHSAKEMLKDLESSLLPERRNEPKITFDSVHADDDHPTRVMPAIRTTGNPVKAADEDEEPPKEDSWDKVRDKRLKPWVKPTIWISVTILLLVGMWFSVNAVKNALVVPEVEVPEVVGLTLEEAEEELRKVNL